MLAAADVSWEDNAEGEAASPLGEYVMTPEEEAAALADPELNPDALVEPAPTEPCSAGAGSESTLLDNTGTEPGRRPGSPPLGNVGCRFDR